MQRMSNFLPSWEKRRSDSKNSASSRSWWPNRASNASSLAKINVAAANNVRIQKEAFWPATLDQECNKAARILKSFCTDGYLAPVHDDGSSPFDSVSDAPTSPIQVPKKIPKQVIQNAAGIAVFTCMRSGLWMTGSGGSGILIARKSDGTWSPPSGIMLHTPTLSFIIGVDIYDCVLVVNSLAALESLSRPRVTLGEDVVLQAGLSVPLEFDEAGFQCGDLGNTVLTYLKARGQQRKVNLNGCILTERGNENEQFYSANVTQMDILAGNVTRDVEETEALFEVIKMAEGRVDYDSAVISQVATEPAPGDAVIATPKSTPASPRIAFGIPDANDPDPFGVLALEMAGLEIREAGSRLRPTSSQFDFAPVPSSPALAKFHRQSAETLASRSNRASCLSTRTTRSQVTDAGTQTDAKETPNTSPSLAHADGMTDIHSHDHVQDVKEEEADADYTTVDMSPLRHISQSPPVDGVRSSQRHSTKPDTAALGPSSTSVESDKSNLPGQNDDESDDNESDVTNDADDEDDESEEEEPVVFEVAAAQPARTQAVASRVIHARGNMVTIAKRMPPPLPMRSPARMSRSNKSDLVAEVVEAKGLINPPRREFSDAGLNGEDERDGAGETNGVETSPNGSGLPQRSPEDDASGDVRPDAAQPDDVQPEKSDRGDFNPEGDQSQESEPNAQQKDADVNDAEPAAAGSDATHAGGMPPMDAEPDEVAGGVSQTPGRASSFSGPSQLEEDADHPAERNEAQPFVSEPIMAQEPSKEETVKMAGETDENEQDASLGRPPVMADSVETSGQNHCSETEAHQSDDQSLSEYHDAEAENSDEASKKHASSIYMGMHDDRWSHDGSSVTTPTSDRPHSAAEESHVLETPTKSTRKRFSEESGQRKVTPTTANDEAFCAAPTS